MPTQFTENICDDLRSWESIILGDAMLGAAAGLSGFFVVGQPGLLLVIPVVANIAKNSFSRFSADWEFIDSPFGFVAVEVVATGAIVAVIVVALSTLTTLGSTLILISAVFVGVPMLAETLITFSSSNLPESVDDLDDIVKECKRSKQNPGQIFESKFGFFVNGLCCSKRETAERECGLYEASGTWYSDGIAFYSQTDACTAHSLAYRGHIFVRNNCFFFNGEEFFDLREANQARYEWSYTGEDFSRNFPGKVFKLDCFYFANGLRYENRAEAERECGLYAVWGEWYGDGKQQENLSAAGKAHSFAFPSAVFTRDRSFFFNGEEFKSSKEAYCAWSKIYSKEDATRQTDLNWYCNGSCYKSYKEYKRLTG